MDPKKNPTTQFEWVTEGATPDSVCKSLACLRTYTFSLLGTDDTFLLERSHVNSGKRSQCPSIQKPSSEVQCLADMTIGFEGPQIRV
jgi:hypothetical protein